MEPKPTLEQELRRMRKELVGLARKLGVKPDEILRLMSQREFVLLNMQLTHIHEMCDLIHKELKEGAARK